MSTARRPGAALESLFARHHAVLWRLALRMAGDPETAKDLVQETFLRALSRRLPDDLRSAEAWLVRALVNLSRDLYRWRRVRQSHAERVRQLAGDDRDLANLESQVVARLTVDRALEGLSARRRAVLVLHDLEGLDDKRVGELLGVRPATVRWHLAAARRELKTRLLGPESEEEA